MATNTPQLNTTVNTDYIPSISHNTTGWRDDRANLLNFILVTHGILICAIQEHMQLEGNLYRIASKFNSYETFSIPAFKNNEVIHQGRPSGGLSLIYSRKIMNYVEHITVPNSYRVQGIKVKLPQQTFVFINTYFPTDPRNENFDDSELIETLEDINFILDTCEHSDNLILLGDFNTDFSRNSRFVTIVKQFIEENELTSVWSKFGCDFTYSQTAERNGRIQTAFSTIDHFIVKNEFLDDCTEACALHIAENLSNHEIIYLKIKVQNVELPKQSKTFEPPSNKPNWLKASPEQISAFQNDVSVSLAEIREPDIALCCRDVHCTNEVHKEQLDTYVVELLNVLEDTVDQNIPKVKPATKLSSVPGWSEFVQPVRDDMLFWHSIWVSLGKQQNTELHRVYRHLRHQYNYALRKVRAEARELRNKKFIESATNGKVNDILKTLKTQRAPNSKLVDSIDNISGPKPISESFCAQYKNIYNTHVDKESLDRIIQSVSANISDADLCWTDKITPALVKKLIGKLNSGKNDEYFSFKSDALKHSADQICSPLANILKASIIHGHITHDLLFSSLTPIPKDNRKSKSNSCNYRLIATSSLILKLIDLVVLELFTPFLSVSSRQFGFQKGSSTALCTWTLTESINYFVNRGSPVYLCLLDMTKAFDLVKLDLLFDKLSKRIPALFVRFIMYTYINQQCYVKWGSVNSSTFSISNGVRQGAIASPIFFNIYMDELYQLLEDSNIGCKIGDSYYGILGYADDCTLICPTREGLQAMINLVRSYCDQHGIVISTNPDLSKSKTKCIIFNSSVSDFQTENVLLYGVPLPWVDTWKHLGHKIHKDMSSSHDLLQRRAEFISKIHALRQELGKIDPKVFILLVQIYFTSFYGSNLWNLTSASAARLYSSWNRMIGTTYNLPFATHRYILKELSDQKPLQQTLGKRFAKFCTQIEKCGKPEVISLLHKQKFDSRSTFGKNYRDFKVNNVDFSVNYNTPVEAEWRVPLIRDLLDIRNKQATLVNFAPEAVNDFLNEACCT